MHVLAKTTPEKHSLPLRRNLLRLNELGYTIIFYY